MSSHLLVGLLQRFRHQRQRLLQRLRERGPNILSLNLDALHPEQHLHDRCLCEVQHVDLVEEVEQKDPLEVSEGSRSPGDRPNARSWVPTAPAASWNVPHRNWPATKGLGIPSPPCLISCCCPTSAGGATACGRKACGTPLPQGWASSRSPSATNSNLRTPGPSSGPQRYRACPLPFHLNFGNPPVQGPVGRLTSVWASTLHHHGYTMQR